MGKRPVRKTTTAKQSPLAVLFVAWVLIGMFIYRMAIPAQEGPSQTLTFVTIAFDSLMVFGLVKMRRGISAPMFWIALAAGIGLFGIRMTGETSFWTGHLAFAISPS